ncbi:sodium channel protein Nach-like [Aricia agestis]|uniref:sodium channel protein Nach-like n=1 Tax=Aricia agestis TaxID=91739 RepID=UPI001C207960|nr:sodium channel protein Nach-like [Aricia agestis]
MKGDAKTLFERFCLESSLLGVKYFYLYNDRFSRCFWLLTILALFSLSCWISVLLYSRFEEMPTRITIENQYEPILNKSFPAVTICSPNQITESSTRHLKRTFALEVLGLIPQACGDFLKVCFWLGKAFDCDELFKPILTQHGMCCSFNSAYHFNGKRNEKISNMEPERITTTGFMNALSIVTDYDPENALDKTITNYGASRLIFSDWREFPSDDESYFVVPYVESFHFIHLTHTYCSDDVASLPATSRRCFFDDEYSLPYFHRFYNSDCDLACDVREVERSCRCTMVFVPNVRPRNACNVTSVGCIMKSKLEMNKWYEKDACVCPRNCISYSYRVEMLSGNLDALPYLASNPYKGIVFNQSTSLMHFIIPSPVFVKQKQETVMSIITMSSNLGGIFGLCLGFSVISVLEILFFIYLAIKNKILSYIQQKKHRKVMFLK